MNYINSKDIKVFPSYWRNTVANAEGQLTVYDLDSGETSENSLTKLNSENKTYVVSYDSGTFEIVVCGYYFKFDVPQELLSSNDLTALVKIKDNVLIPYTDDAASNLDVLVEAAQGVEAHNEFRGLALSTDTNIKAAENVYSLKIWNHTSNSVPKESWFKYKSRDIQVGDNKELGEVVDLVEDVISNNGDINSKNNNKIGTISKPFDKIYVNDIKLLNQESHLTFKDIKAKSINTTTDSWYVDENGNAKFTKVKANLEGTSSSTDKLKNSINIDVDLSEVGGISFDGSRDVSIGVNGILSTSNGGLGVDLTVFDDGILYSIHGGTAVKTLSLSNTTGEGDIYSVNKVDSLLFTNLYSARDYTDTQLANYVTKEPDKQLSTNDFSNDYLNKLNSLENYVLPKASSNALGGVKLGYQDSKYSLQRPLLLDSEGKAYIQISPAAFVSDSRSTSDTTAASCSWVSQLSSRIAVSETDILVLKSHNDVADEKIANLHSNVNSLQNDVTYLQSRVNGLQTNVTNLQSNVTGLQTNVNTLLSATPIKNLWTGLRTNSQGYITDDDAASRIFNLLYHNNCVVTAWQVYDTDTEDPDFRYKQLQIIGSDDVIRLFDNSGNPLSSGYNISVMIVNVEDKR